MSAFKAYDVRGVYGKDFTAETVYRIGRELPGLLGAKRVLVGRDARESSPEIFEALARGITDASADVDYMGLCTTPMTYFFTGLKGYEAAVMITASHNPKEYNGLKISRKNALPVGYDTGLKELEKRVEAFTEAPAGKKGKVYSIDVREEYVEFLRKKLPDLSGLKVAIDCSNGMAGLIARDVFEASGAVAEYLYETPDGTFPNHSPNPLESAASEALRKRVSETEADIGVIFDGDADRVMYVDETGKFIRPDLLTAIIARYYLAVEPGAAILCDIRTSRGVTDEIERCGGMVHLWKVGHAFAKLKMREVNAIAGGELAGHYYLRDFYNCDAAVLSCEIVLGVLAKAKREGQTLSKIISKIDIYSNTGELNYTIQKKEEAIKAVEEWAIEGAKPVLKHDFDGVRYEWEDWWFNIRPSNTEPYLRLVAEALTPTLLSEKVSDIEKILEKFK
jgi:phosphomannomutase